MHKREIPKNFNKGRVIYNGIAKDNVCSRVKHHLLNTKIDEGWSGISIDINPKKYKSHHKKVGCKKGKVPFIREMSIRTKDMVLKLKLSKEEKDYVKSHSGPFYFRNGINIFEPKHKKHVYRVYFITGLSSYGYLELIEKKWRKEYGSPQLCSYESGR